MIIKEGSILYHTIDELFQYNKLKPMLFLTFHPSEWYIANEYITYIKLKRDVSLLFMIEECYRTRIISSLNYPNLNLAKKNPDQLFCYVHELKKENFDGLFSSIENKVTGEVSLINDLNLFEIIKTEKLKRSWRNGGEGKLKSWGKKYIISTIENPVILNLNEKYKKIIDEYKNYEKNSKYFKEYIFQILLDNSIITYHSGNFKILKWNC